jgi:creatinine amidohydrolase
MRYELMLPHQVRKAIQEDWPVVLPLGVLEYHGEHLGLGMDTLVVIKVLERIEKETNLVLLPAFYYGSASYAVEPPEEKGTLHVDSSHLLPFARDLFTSLLRVGFRNIHFFIWHQSENFTAGMPTDLAFKLAARQAIFAFLERERGEGWWGKGEMSDYYANQAKGKDPFSWIQGHPLMNAEMFREFPADHAGLGETSLTMALWPEAVDMSRQTSGAWYTRPAAEATAKLGEKGFRLMLDSVRRALAGPGKQD